MLIHKSTKNEQEIELKLFMTFSRIIDFCGFVLATGNTTEKLKTLNVVT
jgi:hypothetical protein